MSGKIDQKLIGISLKNKLNKMITHIINVITIINLVIINGFINIISLITNITDLIIIINHNNASIPTSTKLQTSTTTIYHLRDNNIALKTNNFQKIDQTLVRIPHTVFTNQAVESNTKNLPSVSNNKKSQHTLPVVSIPPSKPHAYTVPILSSQQNRRLQSSDRSRSNKNTSYQ